MTRRELSYDGRGINGPDDCRTRIATLNPNLSREDRARYGALFEAAPELLTELRALQAWATDVMGPEGFEIPTGHVILKARAAIARATGGEG